jgi:hypothetical protein
MKNKWIYESKYVIFYFTPGFDISFEICGYFDNRPRINLELFFFSLTLIFPFRNKWTDECDPPKWGIAYHNETLWINRGGKGNGHGRNKWWSFYSPFSLQWIKTSALRKDGTWEHETKKDRKDLYRDEWRDVLWNETHPYIYTLKSGEIQNRQATIEVREREWRWHWFKWLPLTKTISKTIEIKFDDEIGEETGSWKGGVTGCGYILLPNETPLECLRRMEIERKF